MIVWGYWFFEVEKQKTKIESQGTKLYLKLIEFTDLN